MNRRRFPKVLVQALTVALAVVALSTGTAQAQLAASCPVTNMNVKAVQVPHRETLQISFATSGGGQSPDTEVFTSVPTGFNFRVTHISGRFSSSAEGNPENSYEVELLTTSAQGQDVLAAMTPSEKALKFGDHSQFRTLNLPWDANYLKDRTYQVRVRRANVLGIASTVRLTFDGYLEPDCAPLRGGR